MKLKEYKARIDNKLYEVYGIFESHIGMCYLVEYRSPLSCYIFLNQLDNYKHIIFNKNLKLKYGCYDAYQIEELSLSLQNELKKFSKRNEIKRI